LQLIDRVSRFIINQKQIILKERTRLKESARYISKFFKENLEAYKNCRFSDLIKNDISLSQDTLPPTDVETLAYSQQIPNPSLPFNTARADVQKFIVKEATISKINKCQQKVAETSVEDPPEVHQREEIEPNQQQHAEARQAPAKGILSSLAVVRDGSNVLPQNRAFATEVKGASQHKQQQDKRIPESPL